MRPFLALFLSFALALPMAQVTGYADLCAGQPEAHACCHHQAPACDTGAMNAAYCCQSDVPTAPLPASQAIPPAPSSAMTLAPPALLAVDFAAFDFPLVRTISALPDTRPPALYQLHRAYRI